MKYLSSKKVLFIGPIFHNYHTAIITKLQEMGADVLFYPEREYGILFKLINNLSKKYLQTFQERHYEKILKQINGLKLDYLFVIRGFMLPQSFVEKFKQMNPSGETIMYQWDSQRTNPFQHLVPSFHKVYSFDFEDCESNPNVIYHPLFYTDDVKNSTSLPRSEPEYDFFFMGWYFPERYAAVLRFKKYATQKGWRVKSFLYIPFLSYIKERLKGINPDRRVVSLKHMSRKEYLKILKASRVMVDVSNPNQTGLAMRIIESFACGTKILTNNKRLKNDVLYDPDYVAFFDDNAPVVNEEFLLNDLSKHNVRVLSIGEWLHTFFKN